jgi:hypothetical protein
VRQKKSETSHPNRVQTHDSVVKCKSDLYDFPSNKTEFVHESENICLGRGFGRRRAFDGDGLLVVLFLSTTTTSNQNKASGKCG